MTRATVLLALGALAGIVLAAAGLVSGAALPRRLSDDAAALVNGHVVRLIDYERMLNAVSGDKRSQVTAEDRRHILDRMIDEELLVQRALDLGLAQVDSRVRRDLTASMLDSIVADTQNLQPSDEELRAYFEDQKDLFGGSEQVRVRQAWFRITTLADAEKSLARANQAAERIRKGEDFEAVKKELGDTEIVPLPDALLPANKLADYLGPTALRAVLDLQPDQLSAPVRSSSGYHLIQLLERAPAPPPPFEQAREQVLEAYKRKAGDDALRAYLDNLRARAEIQIADSLK